MSSSQKTLLIIGVLILSAGLAILAADRFVPGGIAVRGEREDALARIREGDEYLRQNSRASAAAAVPIFNRVLSLNLGKEINQPARYGLGVALERLTDRAAAIEHYRALKREGVLDPDLSEKVDYSLGKLLLYINHEAEGRSLLDGLLARTKDFRLKSRVHTAFGIFYLQRREMRRAREHFAVALKYNPENLQAELGRADAVRGSGRHWDAYEYYDDFLTGNASLAPALQRETSKQILADAYSSGIKAYRTGEYEEASRYFRRAYGEAGDSETGEKSLFWLAESYAALGKNGDALRTFQKVQENTISSMDQPALIKQGILLFQSGKFSEAASSFHRAVDHYPSGVYTDRAKEWLQETEAQIRDRSSAEDPYQDKPKGITDKPQTP